MPKAKKGFSLTELLVVLLVLLLIASFSIPAAWRQIRNAHDLAALTTLRSLQSVHRIARGTFLADGQELSLPVGRTLHIPCRAGEAPRKYVTFVESVMDNAFAGQLPVYEIAESSTVDGMKTEFCYWPQPVEKPELCYTLIDDVLYRTTRPQPGAQEETAEPDSQSVVNEKTAASSGSLS